MFKIIKRISNSTCIFYTIFSLVLNFIPWLFSKNNQSNMLKIKANLIILLFCTIISIVIICIRSNKEINVKSKEKFYIFGSFIYTISFFILNITQYIIKKENFWNGYTLLIILLFGLVCSFLVYKFKFKNYLVASIFNFFVIGIFYYIIFVLKSEYSNGNSLIISLGVYFIIFTLSAFIYYLFIRKKHKIKNSEKSYKNLFS